MTGAGHRLWQRHLAHDPHHQWLTHHRPAACHHARLRVKVFACLFCWQSAARLSFQPRSWSWSHSDTARPWPQASDAHNTCFPPPPDLPTATVGDACALDTTTRPPPSAPAVAPSSLALSHTDNVTRHDVSLPAVTRSMDGSTNDGTLAASSKKSKVSEAKERESARARGEEEVGGA